MVFKNRNAKILLILLMLLTAFFSIQAQKGNVKNLNNQTKKFSGWKDAFPIVQNYRRKFENSQFEDGKIYFQTAEYQSLTDKSDYFEIQLHRHPNVSPERYAEENGWVKHLTVGRYKAYKILPSCGLDFYKYSLEIYPDEMTAVTLKVHQLSNTNGLEVAKNLDFNLILEMMKKQKNIY